MLEAAKLALRISTDAYDEEIESLLKAAELDLRTAGVRRMEPSDDLIRRALITYVRANFGSPDDYERLRDSYELQKSVLMHASDYTDY
jgi:hypothetical protein